MAYDEVTAQLMRENERLKRELRDTANVLARLTAAMTRNGDAHKYPVLMLEADRAVVRSAGVMASDGGQRGN